MIATLTAWATSEIGLKILKYGAIVLTVIGIIAGIRHSGRLTERAERLEQKYKSIRRSNEIEKRVNALPDGDAANELRNHWSR
jgi:hypothetical protein